MHDVPRGEVRWKANVILAVGSLLLGLAAVEGALRWLNVGDPPAFESNPDYGYLMRPNQMVSTRGYRFRINHAGLRGTEFQVPKLEGVYRVIFLGDSITYGGGSIREEDLFVTRVAWRLGEATGQPVEGINVSAPGWGVQNMAAYVARKGLHGGDFLVWVIPSADFRRHKTFLEEHGFWTRKPWSRVAYAAAKILSRPFSPRKDPATLAQNVRAMHETLARLGAGGTPAAVITLPSASRYREAWEDVAAFRSVAESLGVAHLDLEPAFAPFGSEELFTDGVHLTPFGHAVAADAIGEFLQRQVLARGLAGPPVRPVAGAAEVVADSSGPRGLSANP